MQNNTNIFDQKKSSPWRLLFQWNGSIWSKVLPYCILNCGLLVLILFLKERGVRVYISPEGHALMSLIISYLVVSKVGLSYERYMLARTSIGKAFFTIRELHQYTITMSELDASEVAVSWRLNAKSEIITLLDCVIDVLQNPKKAAQLARNEFSSDLLDPMNLIHSLRTHLYHGSLTLNTKIQLLERMRMCDLLHEFSDEYQRLLSLASSPIPFALAQMGGTFLFLWVFSMPLVLVGVVDEFLSALQFTFFLTYGFMGLEFVSMTLMKPFGDGPNQLNLTGMRQAILIGIDADSQSRQKFKQNSHGRFVKFEIERNRNMAEEGHVVTPYFALQHDGISSSQDDM